MANSYSQSTGVMTAADGAVVFSGAYSGNGAGLNNSAMQDVHGVGPLPQGLYTIQAPGYDPNTGPYSMRLTPDAGNEMFGRGDFLVHGDTATANHTASDGCIVKSPESAREALWATGDRALQVTA